MQAAQHESIFSTVRKAFASESPESKKPARKPVAEMRQLTDDELRAVAGGPELEVGNGV